MMILRKFIFLILAQIFLILILITIYNVKYLIKIRSSYKQNTLKNMSAEGYLKNIFPIFLEYKVFLIDIQFLNQISKLPFNDQLKLPNNLTFGVDESDLPGVYNNIRKLNEKFKCNMLLSEGVYFSQENVITNIYIKCEKSPRIQLSIFYKRFNYTWIGSEGDKLNLNPIWFGDVPRLMSQIDATKQIEIEDYQILVPFDIKRFLYDYGHSVMHECNRGLADANYKNSNGRYQQNIERNEKILSGLSYIITSLESQYKHYWLDSGTLLGWYRDCGIIPHTMDMDIAMKIEDYDNNLFYTFLGNPNTRIQVVFGFPDDSLEFALTNNYFKFDVFFVYNWNSTHQYYGYHLHGRKFKQWLPKVINLCSAELINIKVMIPCDPAVYLTSMYGHIDDWKTPKERNYVWPNLDFNNSGSKWSLDRKDKVVKHFSPNGMLHHYEKSPY
jgi:hypothetical protein